MYIHTMAVRGGIRERLCQNTEGQHYAGRRHELVPGIHPTELYWRASGCESPDGRPTRKSDYEKRLFPTEHIVFFLTTFTTPTSTTA